MTAQLTTDQYHRLYACLVGCGICGALPGQPCFNPKNGRPFKSSGHACRSAAVHKKMADKTFKRMYQKLRAQLVGEVTSRLEEMDVDRFPA